MSIPNLPVDFKDDILNTGVNQKRKYQQTYNSDGSVSFEDVTAYQQKGSNFGAQEVNETNGAVNNIYSERILDLDELELVTEPGFFVDAQAVKEAHDSLNSNIEGLDSEAGNAGSALIFREPDGNLTYGCWAVGLYPYPAYYQGSPNDWSGTMFVLPKDTTGARIKISFCSDCKTYMLRQKENGEVTQNWTQL